MPCFSAVREDDMQQTGLRQERKYCARLGWSLVLTGVIMLVWQLRLTWQALAGRDLTAWRGLGVAALVIALAALVVLPAWPDLLPESARWPAALAVLVLSPLLHLLLQRVAPAPLVSLRASPLATASRSRFRARIFARWG